MKTLTIAAMTFIKTKLVCPTMLSIMRLLSVPKPLLIIWVLINPSATTKPDLSFFDLPLDALRHVGDLNLLGTIFDNSQRIVDLMNNTGHHLTKA